MNVEYGNIGLLAEKHKKLDNLLTYVNSETLLMEHKEQKKYKASGVDGVDKDMYGENLKENIENLMNNMKSMKYKPQPVRRVEIPKAGSNKTRPLGIPVYEDKLLQGCMTKVLNEIYERRFLDCSYGFRPNRNCHQAIKEINDRIFKDKVNYVLDADIKGFFDNINHKRLMEFLENDIADSKFLTFVQKFLKSGVMNNMQYMETDKGTPQGGIISPVLANVYLHYVLDLWFEVRVKPNIKGEAYLVRYADDFVILFQYENEAVKVYKALTERLKKFGLEIAEDKTKIIRFGRNSKDKSNFDFLGFRFIDGKTRNGFYRPQLKIDPKKKKAKKQAIKEFIQKNMHMDMNLVIKRINIRLGGMYRYYGVNGMYEDLLKLYRYVIERLFRTLNRRGQKKMNLEKYNTILKRIPILAPKIYVQIW